MDGHERDPLPRSRSDQRLAVNLAAPAAGRLRTDLWIRKSGTTDQAVLSKWMAGVTIPNRSIGHVGRAGYLSMGHSNWDHVKAKQASDPKTGIPLVAGLGHLKPFRPASGCKLSGACGW